ncbi:hypothetical protein WA026_003735 [Henosepilachna vigintioctopunctata]|uniref:NADP-dependent oxidoreductase domain-containing protein n=1 Tax=Henosepilachna vigintioctopunctata TaxID=420089 RepID=A0AAW1U5D5_9CUCU
MAAIPTVTLNNGNKMPQLGLGTWAMVEGECREAIEYAISIGYRHIDTAMLYGTEKEVGEAVRAKIEDGTVKRDELFITTKLWNTFHKDVVAACKKSLEFLGLDYLDLYLMHSPVAQQFVEEISYENFTASPVIVNDFVETWKGMEECVKLGLTKSIGISNFNCKQVARILEEATILPVTNQVEVTPLLTQKKQIDFCKDRNILITAYSPFKCFTNASPHPDHPGTKMDHPIFLKIAQKYGKTPSQVILRYLVDKGTVPIPKSSNRGRIKENMDIFDFELTDNEVAAVDGLNANYRGNRAFFLIESEEYPYHED